MDQTQKVDAGGDDLKGCNRRPASEHRNRLKGSNSCQELRREPRKRTPGTVLSTNSPAGTSCRRVPSICELLLLIFELLCCHLLKRCISVARVVFFRLSQILILIRVLPSSMRCLTEPNWVHCQESPRRKKRPDPSSPEPGIPGWDELPARPGYSDGCAASFQSPAALWSAPPSTAAPSKVQIPGRIQCSTFQLVHCCSCKVLASYRPFFPDPLNLSPSDFPVAM